MVLLANNRIALHLLNRPQPIRQLIILDLVQRASELRVTRSHPVVVTDPDAAYVSLDLFMF